MYQNFAAWLTRLSIGSAMKSPNMISNTGRRPGHRGAVGGAGERQLRDRRVEHAVGPEPLVQVRRRLEHAARRGDVLAEEDDRRIALDLLGEGVADRDPELERAHAAYSVAASAAGSG